MSVPLMRSVQARLATGALGVVLLLLVGACSGSGGGEGLPSVTATPSRTVSATLPSVALPSGSRTPATLPSASQGSTTAIEESTPGESEESESAPAVIDRTSEPPSSESAPTVIDRTSEPPSSESAPTVIDRTSEPPSSSVQTSAEVSDSEAAATTAAAASDSEDSSAWPLWALAALVIAAVAIALWLRSRSRRRDQRSAFELALAEARWLGQEALPTLLSASSDERRGAWRVTRPRVAALEVRLGELASPGSDSVAAVNARHLKTAVTGVRSALDDEAESTGPEAAAGAHGAARQAARQLDQVLTELLPSDHGNT